MKIQQQKRFGLKKILLVAAAITLIFVGGAYNYTTSFQTDTTAKESTENQNSLEKNVKNSGLQSQSRFNEGTEGKPAQDGTRDVPANSGQDPDVLYASLTTATQNGDVIQIRTLIEHVTSQGSCTLTLSKSGSTIVTKTASIQPTASSSTCTGFDVPTYELSQGIWQVIVDISSEGKKAHLTGSITVT